MADRGKALLVLSWLWVAVVAGYLAWGAINYAGLYAWLADLQVERSGSYRQELTAMIPGFVLAAPALWYIRLRSQIALALEEPGPASEARRRGRTARNLAIIGLLCAAVAGGAYMLSQRVPDGSEQPVPLDLAALGRGEVPQARVSVRGNVDSEAASGTEESSRYLDRATLYVGFRPEAGAKDEPLRFFVERRFGNAQDARTAQGFLPEQTGYLVENGLPPLALRDLERRGIAVASPHYVLRTGGDARRENYYIVAGVAGIVALACLAVALIAALEARSRARRAAAG
jgi:hypothetical protein